MSRPSKRRALLAAMLLAGTAALSACGGGSDGGSGGAASEGVLVVGYRSANPSSLDPTKSTSAADNTILWTFYDTLIDFDPETLEARPGLAKAWEFEDPQTLRLDLVQGATFHDGTPFDAEAVKFNLDRSRDASSGSTVAGQLAAIESIEVRDASTPVLHLSRPAASLVLVLSDRSGMMGSPTAIKADEEGFAKKPVGAGPFEFESWNPGSELKVTRFDAYRTPAKLKGITFKSMPDPTARINALRSGDVDLIYDVDPTAVGPLESDSKLTTYVGSSIEYANLYTNMSLKPLDDVKVRQAISMAIDREALTDAVTDGRGEPAYLPVRKESFAYSAADDGKPAYDPEAAKQLLTEAGYPNGTSFDLVMEAGGVNDRKAEIIQADLEKIGIKVNVKPSDAAQASEAYLTGKAQAYLARSTTGPEVGQIYRVQFTPEGLTNAGKFDDEQLVADINAGDASDDPAVRAQAYARVNQRVVDLAFNIPLHVQPNIVVYNKKVKGFVPNLWAKPKFDGVSIG